MQNRNKVIFSLLLGITFLLSLSVVSAGVSIISPSASATISGTTVFNVTNASAFDEMVNCTIYLKSSLTANSSWTSVGTFDNDTLSNVNGTFGSATFEDANNYIINATCRNSSNDLSDDTNTGIIVDNTVPVASTGLTPTSDDDGALTISGTVTGARTTSCVLYFDGINPGSPTYTMTHTGDNCSYDFTTIPEQSYRWYIRASDETNTTDSSTQTTTVSIDTPSNYLFQGQKDISVSEGGTLSVVSNRVAGIPVWLIGLIVVLVIGVVIAKRK
ncbi:MAG: hypothetical protein KKB31_05155 [Nanoarchaeota archaeon]|nr:hypothetical protein [Nanoarchaeota archaeon]